ncbi:MAG TPA: ABC transporter ATP-binding protein [Anaerolineae bacterium]|nr:ABC transporter ATP-binding protein [Anaerolineae bacterium]HOR01393.1 ABC transporter ATP-binding protein [Anaerolineae bacterium]HPL27997.1 ABC transporter ATP-binding protein [Anaerolineae bacterium]
MSGTSQSTPSVADLKTRMLAARGPGAARFLRIEKARDPHQALARLLPYLRPFRLALGVVLALVIAFTLLGLVGPYLMGQAIDVFIAGKDPAGLARVALFMLVLYVLTNLFQAVANWVMARLSQQALKGLRRDLFAHLQSLSIGFFDTHPAGELMSRLTNDIEAINQAVSQNVTSLLAGVLSLAGILVAMFALNAWLALATLVVVPIMFWFTEFVAKYTRKGFRLLQERLGALNGVMEEAISGQKVVKAFGRNDAVLEAFREQNHAVFEASIYANTYAMMLMPLTNVLSNFFVIVLAGLGGWLALHGLVSVGMIATFISYGQNFVGPLRQLASIYNSIQAALAGAERVFETIDTPPEVPDVPDALPLETTQGHVRFDEVTFGYTPGTPIIKRLSLEAQPGQTIALVGPTGAGKTTIINLLTRFYEIEGGRITIDSHDIRRVRKADLRRQLGLVLQDVFLFADTVMENVRYGRLDATDAEVMRAAELADADHFIRQLPQGYQTVLAERAANLSQGQRQLLAIARAILADPAILILDEATSSVDTRTEARIQKALLRLMQGRTSFVIAHRLSTIRDADNVIVIDHGEIVEQGTHQQLLDRRGLYHHLYVSQFKGQAI